MAAGVFIWRALAHVAPGGVQGRRRGRGLFRKAEAVCRLFTDFDCRNDQNLKISHNSPPDCWPVCLTVESTRHWGMLSPLVHDWRRLWA